jgi:hypothetical protein
MAAGARAIWDGNGWKVSAMYDPEFCDLEAPFAMLRVPAPWELRRSRPLMQPRGLPRGEIAS